MNWCLLTFIYTDLKQRDGYVLRLNCKKCQEGWVYGWQLHKRVSPVRIWAIQKGLAEDLRSGPCYVLLKQPEKEGAFWPSWFAMVICDLERSVFASCFRWWWGSSQPSPSLTVEWMAVSMCFLFAGWATSYCAVREVVCLWVNCWHSVLTSAEVHAPILQLVITSKSWLHPPHPIPSSILENGVVSVISLLCFQLLW